MKLSNTLRLILLILTLFYQGISAQEKKSFFMELIGDSTHMMIKTIHGNEFIGNIIFYNDSLITLETEPGVHIYISKYSILDYKILNPESIVQGKFLFENPHATRYFYGPNGYGLKRNEGYYQNLWVMFNQVSLGFTNYFSMGAGVIPLFLFAGAPTPVWITPKFSIPVKKDRVNLGIGALAGTILGESESSFGIPFGTLSLGTREKNATLGAGWVYTSDGFSKNPIFSLSGMIRYGKKGYFITENYLIAMEDESLGILSAGGRIVQKKLAVDYGLFVPLNIDSFLAFPWLSITLPFGVKNKLK